ncbi:MAG: hypothetical protein COA74_11725 [Gammaproteobacteria bacterium]|nr:MAG: hypothetical protein COA74_11725 [Gammaproteobacteria bacterium]
MSKEKETVKKEQSTAKSGLKNFGIFIVLMYILFCLFGNGLSHTKSITQSWAINLGIVEPYEPIMHMTSAQNVAYHKNKLPPQEFKIWKDMWDLRDKSDEWKENHFNEVNQITEDFHRWQDQRVELRKNDPSTYYKRYKYKPESTEEK